MGQSLSQTPASNHAVKRKLCTTNQCRYETVGQVRNELHRMGFEACELIVGVDFTESKSKPSSEGSDLKTVGEQPDQYLEVLKVVAKRLKTYDDDRALPCYGFGGVSGKEAVFSMFDSTERERGLDALVEKYKSMASGRSACGTVSFAPLIRQAMRDVYNSGMKFHVLLIISDCQISPECLEDTKHAITQACSFPLSIVVIGIGEGPWTEMNAFDKELPEREWDNFRFFDYNEISKQAAFVSEDQLEDEFEFNVIAEIPEQYVYARNLTGESNRTKVASLVDRIPSNLLVDAPSLRS